jgi:hypothetical protein
MVVVPAPPNDLMVDNWFTMYICGAIALRAVQNPHSLSLVFLEHRRRMDIPCTVAPILIASYNLVIPHSQVLRHVFLV